MLKLQLDIIIIRFWCRRKHRRESMIYFETQRLIFRDWKKQDLSELQLINKDTRVMEYFPKILSEEETNLFYNTIQAEFCDLGYGLYAVETKCSGDFIGFIGFHRATFNADFTPCVEIGWRLKYDFWGNGYATEGASGCLDYGFRKFSFDKVYSFTAKLNIRSENVMKKTGMIKIREFNHPNVYDESPLREHVLYLSIISKKCLQIRAKMLIFRNEWEINK
jgi:ribosomal-protein-alanine N-acetyltransferase